MKVVRTIFEISTASVTGNEKTQILGIFPEQTVVEMNNTIGTLITPMVQVGSNSLYVATFSIRDKVGFKFWRFNLHFLCNLKTNFYLFLLTRKKSLDTYWTNPVCTTCLPNNTIYEWQYISR